MHFSDASVACAQLKEAFGGDKLKSGELKRLTTGHKNRQSLTTALSPRTSNGKVADESGFESANHWHPMLIYAVTRKICWYAPATPRNGSVVHRTAPRRTARVDMAGRSCKRSRRFRSEAILRKAAKARWLASSTSQHGAQPGCA